MDLQLLPYSSQGLIRHKVRVTSVTFRANTATVGGAIFAEGPTAFVSVDGATIANNRASAAGGGVAVVPSIDSATLSCPFHR